VSRRARTRQPKKQHVVQLPGPAEGLDCSARKVQLGRRVVSAVRLLGDALLRLPFDNRWLITATGKLGSDRVLVYGKGAGAWVGAETVDGLPASFTSTSTSNFGWTAGIGVEWAFAGN
jgi:hypothetical protein